MKYVVHYSDYMGDKPTMYSIEAKDDKSAILIAMDIDDDVLNDKSFDVEEAIEDFKQSNGDGMPYVSIFNVDENKQILG